MILILILMFKLALLAETIIINTIRSAYKVLHYYYRSLYSHIFKYKTHTFKSYSTHTLHTALTLIKLLLKSKGYTHVLRLDKTYMYLTDNYG